MIEWILWVIHRLDKDARPEIYNLLSLMAAATNQTLEAVYEQYKVAEGGKSQCRTARWHSSSHNWQMHWLPALLRFETSTRNYKKTKTMYMIWWGWERSKRGRRPNTECSWSKRLWGWLFSLFVDSNLITNGKRKKCRRKENTDWLCLHVWIRIHHWATINFNSEVCELSRFNVYRFVTRLVFRCKEWLSCQ